MKNEENLNEYKIINSTSDRNEIEMNNVELNKSNNSSINSYQFNPYLLPKNFEKVEITTENQFIIPKKETKSLLFKFVIFLIKIPILNCLLYLGTYYYNSSLIEVCKFGDTDCYKKWDQEKIKILMIEIIKASLIFSANFGISISNIINRYNIIFQFIYIYTITYKNNGITFEDYSYYTKLFLLETYLILITIISVIYLILLIIWKSYKFRKFLGIFLLIISIIIPYHFGYNFIQNSCQDFDVGMKKSKLDDTRNCKIKRPKICYEVLLNNVFDVSMWLWEDCQTIKNDSKSPIREFTNIKNDFSAIAYPRTENWNFLPDSLFVNYRSNVLKKIKDVSQYDEDKLNKENIETWVDFRGEIPKLNIKVRKNEKLIKIRNDNFNLNKSKLLFKNVLFVFVDSVSRNHFRRKLPKFYKWIEQFYINDNNTQTSSESNMDNKFETFQFMKYHATGTWTNANLYPMFNGRRFDQYDGKYLIRDYQNKGYMTASITNQCSREFVDIHNERRDWINWDHELTSMFCDPNFITPSEYLHYVNGPYGYRKKCLYSKPTLSYAIEYAEQFLNLYKEEAKFVRIGSIDGHEGSGEVVKYNDELLVDFMEKMKTQGHMDETLTIVTSDHGYTMPGYHEDNQTEDHVIEKTLPFLSFIIPKNIKDFDTIRQNLKYNEQSFITPFDLHTTFISILNDELVWKNNLGGKILFEKIDRDDGCKYFGIKDDWCRCEKK